MDLIIECISTVSYSVMINGSPKGHIIPSKGLRQGNPLSPYLFLICAEWLSALIRKAERDQKIHGVAICRGGPRLSHLFFANDGILFYNATKEESKVTRDLLLLYENASGQKLNSSKTSLFFSGNVSTNVLEDISSKMRASQSTQIEKYLGLPPIIKRSKRKTFKEQNNRIWKKVNRWKAKLLSQAKKEVLIKSMAQAIPTYAIGCFKFSSSLYTEINSILGGY